jgi:UDP-N-acetylglucosamine--N-acetylmuramyl-(pentapeptide) pyrophosphoryl-undecaprenol N-acetylglucosamine transferase
MSHGLAMSESVTSAGAAAEPRVVRVLIAASGTGGHLIPALHIARAIQERNPRAVIEFIGSGRPLEAKLIDSQGFKRHVVAAAGIKRRRLTGVAQFVARFPKALVQLRKLYKSFAPDVVVGVGGYVSVLPVIVARMSGIPTWIHEAELHPGLANRTLAHFADWMSLAFAETVVRGRAQREHTGHPVRSELLRVDRETIREDAPRRLLVLGGSQGARGVDEALGACAELLVARKVEVVHQCREENMERVLSAYKAKNIPAHVVSFIDDMAGAYEWADVVISRAGASSVAEIACVNRPAIFIPYPFQQGTHQTDNAMTLVSKGKALLVDERDPAFSLRVREAIEKILSPETFRTLKGAPYEARGLEAARAIAKGILSIVKR